MFPIGRGEGLSRALPPPVPQPRRARGGARRTGEEARTAASPAGRKASIIRAELSRPLSWEISGHQRPLTRGEEEMRPTWRSRGPAQLSWGRSPASSLSVSRPRSPLPGDSAWPCLPLDWPSGPAHYSRAMHPACRAVSGSAEGRRVGGRATQGPGCVRGPSPTGPLCPLPQASWLPQGDETLPGQSEGAARLPSWRGTACPRP